MQFPSLSLANLKLIFGQLAASNLWTGAQQSFQVVGAGIGFTIQAEGATTFSVTRVQANAQGGLAILRKARGTIAVPGTVNNGDLLGTLRYDAFGATAYQQGAMITGTVITATPSDTDMQTRLEFLTSPAGSVTPTSVMRLESALGLSMFGANIVIDANRLMRLRSFTFGTLPSAVGIAGAQAAITDSAAAPVWNAASGGGGATFTPVHSDGAVWRNG